MPTVQERQEVLTETGRSLSSLFNLPSVGGIKAVNFWDRLARYDPIQSPICQARKQLENGAQNVEASQYKSHLARLPVELLDLVLERTDKREVVCLALTCRFLLKIVLVAIERDILNTSAPWAGVPIAVVGNYLESLPTSFFENGLAYSSVRMHDLIDVDLDNGKSFTPRRWQSFPARRYYWATSSRYTNPNESPLTAWSTALAEVSSGPDPRGRLIKVALCNTRSDVCGATEYYLRNLTTRQLICVCNCDGPERAHVSYTGFTDPFAEGPQLLLDDVLVMQTRWSKVDGRYIHTDGHKMIQESWAGHEFDIVTRKAHETEHPGLSQDQISGYRISHFCREAGPVSSTSTVEWKDMTKEVLIKASKECSVLKKYVKSNLLRQTSDWSAFAVKHKGWERTLLQDRFEVSLC